MEYVARHYFPLKTGLATPGEILTDLPEDIVPRLLEKGAIETIAPATAAAKPEEAPEAEAPETEAPENEAETEAEDETEAPETEDTEPDEEVEIDALDGVVTEPKEEEKPKGRKKSDKAKGGKA